MKIVINKCRGGFEVSPEGIKWLVDNNADCVEKLDFIPSEYKYAKPRFYCDEDKIWWSCKSDYEIVRHDAHLVRMVEILKHKANGEFASLSIVEIPDSVKYIIQNERGYEWIAEEHRIWS